MFVDKLKDMEGGHSGGDGDSLNTGDTSELSPHCLGTKNGRDQALFYQFAGGSKSGLSPDGSTDNWRCLFIDELTNVRSERGRWHTAPNESRPQRCVDQVDVEVSP